MKSLLPFVILALCGCANTAREAPYTTELVPAEKAGGFACAAESVQYAIGQKTSVELGSKWSRKADLQRCAGFRRIPCQLWIIARTD